ncbi:hypothetical protein Lser_V15G39965 [Lactuca serriola]
MNSSYAPPPSASSGGLRSLKVDFPEEVQPTVADVYGTEPPPPTYSGGFTESSQPQFPAVGQRALPAYEAVLQPPPITAVRSLEHSSNQLSGNGNRGWVDTDGGAGGSLSGLVHKNNSAYGVVDPYSYEEAPGLSGFAERDRSNNGSSTNNMKFDPLANPMHSMTGNNFRNAYKQFNQSYHDDEDLDSD